MRNDFYPALIIAGLARKQQLMRRRIYRRSQLDRYRAELVILRQAGATLGQLQLWLKAKRLTVARSTILRYLDRLPEVAHG
jgi:hypothetical protein